MNDQLDPIVAKFLRSAIKPKTSVGPDQLHRQTLGLAERIRNTELADEVISIAKKLIEITRLPQGQQNQTQAISLIRELKGRGWPHSAEVVYGASLPLLRDMEAPDLVALAPTAKALTALCKKLPSVKKAIDEIVDRPPSEWLETAVADWLFQHAKVPKLESAFIEALRLPKRPMVLKTPEELLQSAAVRDKKGSFLFAVVRNVEDSAPVTRFASIFLGKPKLAKAYLAVIRSPKAQKRIGAGLPKLIQALVSSTLANQRRSPLFRQTASLFMVGVISDMMISETPNKPVPQSMMNVIEALNELETTADSEEEKSSTWVVHTLEKPKSSGAPSKIDLDAARILKIAFEETDRGANPIEVLEATAFNMGLRQIEEPDTVTKYDPRLHEDVVGGLHPGDSVKILRRGWSLDDTPIIRAKVTVEAT